MKNILNFLLSIIFLSIIVLLSNAHAADITLSGQIEDGYHIADSGGNIEILEDSTIVDGRFVICVAEGTTTISTGFNVETGGMFYVSSGTPSEISETIDYDSDGTPDYWEFYNTGAIENDSTGDYDDDGLPDWYELITYGDVTSHNISDGSCDCD